MPQKTAEPYSGKNPVPTITTKLTALVNPEKATEAKAQQLQDQSARDDEKQAEKAASKLAKGRTMHVKDPTTGEELDISNADEEVKTENKGENVLHQDLPSPDVEARHEHVESIARFSVSRLSGAFIAAFLLSIFFNSIALRILCVLPPAFSAYCLLFRANKLAADDFERRLWHAERIRGLRAGSDLDGDGKVKDEERTRESAEWANAILRGLWPFFNTDMLSSVVDMLEDIMQSSVPTFIHSVRVADIGLGSNAGRITSIRSLPDADEPKPDDTSQANKSAEGLGVDFDVLSADGQDALNGDHVNLEVSFAYQGLPSGRTAQSKAQNIHLLVEFFLGLKNVYGFRVPIWVEITGAVGTARARLQLIPDPPFVKTTLVTLLGLPQITISVVPMNRILPNIMNLPFISGFISSALDTAAAEYVAPKSLTLDLQRLISGDDIKKDTDAIGVLIVHIHRATGLKAMDTGGGSDPYVTLTFSRLEKPLYSTRIIKSDCNPVFEETTALAVDINTVKLKEKLSFQLWDSDRMSVDDMMGFADIDIVDLIRRRGEPVRHVSPLASPDSRDRPGSIEYTVGYYGKLPPNETLKTDGSDPNLPEDLKDKPEFKDARAVALNDLEAAVLVTPPDPKWPSGLLSMQVHEIRDLCIKTMGKGRGKKCEGEKGQDDGEEVAEEGEGLPSAYCTISLNDELAYETRVKPITSSPIFNAGMERFVRDWRSAHVAVTVKDARMRENDVILGTVFLKLSDIFVNASEVTRCYSLENGLGSGRIRISLLFRAVEAKLPQNLLGFDIGTLEIRDIAAISSSVDLSKCEVRMKVTTAYSQDKVSRKAARPHDDGTIVWTHKDPTRLPVNQRYAAALLISLRNASGFKSTGRKAFGVLWLRDIMDRAPGEIALALWRARDGDYSRMKLNYAPPDGDLSSWDADAENYERLGALKLDCEFIPGLSDAHMDMNEGRGARKRGSWDEYDRQKSAGFRDAVGLADSETTAEHRAQEHLEAEQQDVEDVAQHHSDIRKETTDTPAPTPRSTDNSNTIVSPDSAGITESPEGSSGSLASRRPACSDEHDQQRPDDGDHDGDGARAGEKQHTDGLIGKVKGWRAHERELHRDHRGIMQAKPARTAEWIVDNIEDGAHAVKDRFKMKARQPDVETEV